MSVTHRLMIPRILWFAILSSVGMYGLVLAFVRRPGTASPPQTMLLALVAAAACVAVVSLVLPGVMYRGMLQRARQNLPAVDITQQQPMSAEMFRAPAHATRSFRDPGEALRFGVVLFQTPFVLSLALSEAVALFGFVAGFLGAAVVVYVPMMCAGALLVSIRFPTLARVMGPIEKATGAQFQAIRA